MAEDLERNNTATDAGVDYSSKLGEITTDIKSLADVPEDNDTQAKENLKTSLNENFLSGIAEFLNKPENELQKTELVNSVKDVLSKHKDDENFQTEYKSLIDLANALNIDYTSVEQVAEDDPKSGPERPDDLNFQGEITDVPPATDDQKNNRTFFNGIYNKPDNAPEGEKSQLESFEDKISAEYLVAIDGLLSSGLDDNQKANLEQIKKDLNNVLNIMGNPDKANTQKLQDFIFANLDENDKEQFKRDNHFREGRGFDGDFGIKTLEGLQKVLSKIEDHINSLKNYLKAIDDNKKNEILDNLKNGEKTFKKGGTPEEFIASLNLPEGVTATFASDEEKAKLDNEGAQEIKLNVTINGETQEIAVKVNIASETADAPVEGAGEGSGENTPEKPMNTEPITVGEGQHLVMSNSNQLASKYNLDGATFYSASAFNGAKAEGGQAEGEQTQPQLAENTEMEDGEYVYYVKFNGMPNTYKIRVNEQGGLFPLTTEYNSFADGLETRALIKNNECCVNYLKDKLGIPGISIQRNGGINDYTIRSFGEEITVEPMTMDKQRVSKDLGVCLRMLNLTNYLTSGVNEELKGTDPNLRLRGDKLQVQTIQGWKNISEETMRNFGLAGVDDGDMKRFIRYNNHEQWDDNWDRKSANKNYKKINIASSAQVLGGSQTAGGVEGRRFSSGSSSTGSGSVDVPQAQADRASGSAEVSGEVLQQSALMGLLEGIKLNDLGTMRSSGHGYQLFEFNDVKTEGGNEGDNNGAGESAGESANEGANEGGNKYIEIGGHKFMEASDNFTGLGYKVDVYGVYIGEFKDGKKSGIGIEAPSTSSIDFPTYIGSFEGGLKNGNGKLALNGDSYQGEFKNGLGVGEGEFTWSNGNKFKGTFDNPLGEGYLDFQIRNNNGSVERLVINPSNGEAMYVDNFFIGEMKSGTLTIDGKDYEVTDGKYTTESGETKEIPHP